jgi:hypothetical protein
LELDVMRHEPPPLLEPLEEELPEEEPDELPDPPLDDDPDSQLARS